jgi:large subunit ribosomal protein L29
MLQKAKEFRDQSLAELEALHEDYQRELFDLNNQFKGHKKKEKPHEIRHMRKNIARLLTVMTEKRSQEQK